MALQIGRALGRGARRVASLSGIVVFLSTLVSQLAVLGAMNTIVVDFLPAGTQPGDVGTIGFTLPISTDVAVGIALAGLLVGAAAYLVAARLLARDPAALSTLPGDLVTRRFGRAFLSMLVVGAILSIVIPIGLAFLFVPGIFFAVSFQFAVFAVAVEDAGPFAALRRSWDLASGNRWRLFVLLLVLAVLGGVASTVGTVISLTDPLVGQLLSVGIHSVFLVLLSGVLADAYLQVRSRPTRGSGRQRGTTDVEAL